MIDKSQPLPSEVFAKRLRQTRELRRMSQAELARRMTEVGRPLSKLAVLRIESGERKLTLNEAFAFAAVLSAVPDQMFSPVGDEIVWLTDNQGVDGEGMRAWLRVGDSFIASAGELSDERLDELARQAILGRAQALLDAQGRDDKAGITEAFMALKDAIERPDELREGFRTRKGGIRRSTS